MKGIRTSFFAGSAIDAVDGERAGAQEFPEVRQGRDVPVVHRVDRDPYDHGDEQYRHAQPPDLMISYHGVCAPGITPEVTANCSIILRACFMVLTNCVNCAGVKV